MKVEGTHRFPAKREVVWEMLLDPEVIAKTMPGTREMKRVAHERYEGRIGVGIGGLVAAELDVSIVLAEVVRPERYTMLIDGHGRLGFVRGSALVRLEADGADGAGTALTFMADVQVGGKVSGVGQKLLDSVAGLLMKQGLEGLVREVRRRLRTAR